ncbi:MAG: dockerin type I repeat-containing protein [Candidatus Zixiibacteriota bacterium]|nr:MAG: dockerin type I repeat-containing protein [candidate division Zixibacteria bacterium]
MSDNAHISLFIDFVRGDANGDGIINVGDIVYLVSYLYKNGPAPSPVEVGDCNCDGIVNVGDIVYLVSYLFKNGPPPG